MRALIAISLLSLSLAGCLSESNSETPLGPDPVGATASERWHLDAIYGKDVDPADFDHQDQSEVHLEVHDHGNRDHHLGLTTPNFQTVAWNPLVSEYHGQSAGGYYCGEVSREGERKLAIINSFSSAVAVAVVDVTDPTNPEMLGELVLPNTHIYDSAVTDDGRYAVLATSPLAPVVHTDGSQPSPGAKHADSEWRPEFQTRCGTFYGSTVDEKPYESGTMLVDLADPEHPVVADFVPGPAVGPHSVSSTTIDGTRFATASITNLQYESSYFQFFTVEDTPAGSGKLVPYSEYTAQYAQGEAQGASETDPEQEPDDLAFGAIHLLNGHVDATMYKHPVTGQIVAGLANWDGGMITIDLSLPAAPVPLSTWGASTDKSVSHGGVIHSVIPVEDLIGDRFYVIAGQEVGSSFDAEGNHRPTGQIVVVDLTDPEAPEPVARWTLPMELHWTGGLRFSTHYFAVSEDTLFVAMYHGGVWAVDLSQEAWPEMSSLGVFIPDQMAPEGAASQSSAYSPEILDVFVLEDGRVLTFDSASGAYVLEFTRESQVPAMGPWMQDAWLG